MDPVLGWLFRAMGLYNLGGEGGGPEQTQSGQVWIPQILNLCCLHLLVMDLGRSLGSAPPEERTVTADR